MSMNFLAAKGSLKPQNDVTNVMQDWAKIIAKGNSEEEPAKDPLRETVTEIVKTKLLNPVEVPQYTTIDDILNAQKGDRLGAIADYLNNPETMRTIGNFLPKYGYNPQTGRMRNIMDDPARRQEAQMQADQEKALEAQKQQNALAGNIYGDFVHQDIENLRDARERDMMKQRAEQFEKEMAWKREELAANRAERAADRNMRYALSTLIHGGGGGSSSGGGSSTGGAARVGGTNLNNIKMTAAERKALTENKTTLANIDAGLKSLEKNKDAYSLWKGLLGSDITNRIDPKGVATRTQIDNITAVYRKWLTGAQMSDKERKAYERFLPAPTDNYTIVKSKLEGMKGAVQRSNDAILSNYGINSSGNADPLGLGL